MLLIQQLVNSLMLGSVYVTVAVAFTLTIGILNFLNFTIPTLFMLAAMLGWALAYWGIPFGLSGPMAWPLALLIGVLVAIIVSLIIERFTFRYLKTRYGDSTEHAIPLVSSLGFLLVLENIVRLGYGTDAQRFPGPARSDDDRVRHLHPGAAARQPRHRRIHGDRSDLASQAAAASAAACVPLPRIRMPRTSSALTPTRSCRWFSC